MRDKETKKNKLNFLYPSSQNFLSTKSKWKTNMQKAHVKLEKRIKTKIKEHVRWLPVFILMMSTQYAPPRSKNQQTVDIA